jgi:hypothetical protein
MKYKQYKTITGGNTMLSYEEINKNQKEDKNYIAIGDNGKEYTASWVVKYPAMFFCIPSTVEVIGYKEA